MKTDFTLRKSLVLLLFFVLTSFSVNQLHAQPGTLDPSFNPADAGLGAGDAINNTVLASAIQADGKVIIGGFFTSAAGKLVSRVARLNTDGTVDAGFNPGTGPNAGIYDLTIQNDGKILIVGEFTTFNGVARSRVARLNADGSLDNTFNPGTGANDTLWTVDVQSDGKILIGGELTTYNSTAALGIARLNTNGTLDATFNLGGAGPSSTVYSISVSADNKIFIGGAFTQYNGTARSAYARLNADGTLDNAFNIGAGGNGVILSSAIQNDGKILIGGVFTSISGTTINRIARINTDGSRDATFNPGSGANNIVWIITPQADGTILVGGDFTLFNGANRNRITRLTAAGATDNTFTPGTGATASVYAISVRANAKILIGGSFGLYNDFSSLCFAQLNSDGTFDTDYNKGSGANSDVFASLVQNDGKIYLGGRYGKYNGVFKFGILRVNTDGSIDNTFDVGVGTNNSVLSIAQQADGKILIGGFFTTYKGVALNRIARINTNGSVDGSFNIGTGANSGYISKTFILPDGKLMICGSFTQFNGIARSMIARLNADGSIDASFNPGSGGGGVGTGLGILAFARQADGKYIIGGDFTTYNGTTRNRIARVNADGSLDATFNVGSGFGDNTVRSITVQPDGKVIVTGNFTTYNGTAVGRIVRLNADGSLDATFNVGSGAGDNSVLASQLFPGGKVLITGSFTTFNGSPSGNIIMLNSNGSVDNTFQPGVGASGVNSSIASFSVQPTDGKIIIGGNFTSYNGTGRNRAARINGPEAVPTVTTGSVAAGPYCPGSSISVPFTITGTFVGGNVFTAELSNASGSFASPVNIGTLSGTTSGSINATIPPATAAGIGYKIRVVSSTPVTVGSEIGINIQALQVFFRDQDNDGYTDSTSIAACIAPAGYKPFASLAGSQKDCNDNNNTIYPGAPEITNDGIDQDCNGSDLISTGVRDVLTFNAAVYPNPNNGQFSLSVAAPVAGEYVLNILDLSGRLISSTTQYLGIGQQTLSFTIDHPGMYLVSIQNESHESIIRVVVF